MAGTKKACSDVFLVLDTASLGHNKLHDEIRDAINDNDQLTGAAYKFVRSELARLMDAVDWLAERLAAAPGVSDGTKAAARRMAAQNPRPTED